MDAINKDIRDIRNSMEKHNTDHEKNVAIILKSQQEAHDIHIVNQQILKNIEEQNKIRNGRIEKLEGLFVQSDKAMALLQQTTNNVAAIVSKQNVAYESYVKQRELLEEKKSEVYVTKVENAPIQKIVYGLVGLLLTGVMGAILALVLK